MELDPNGSGPWRSLCSWRVTLIGIYFQLRLARSANAFEQINRITADWESERTTRHTLKVYLALRDKVDPEDVPEGAATFLINFWENVAALVRAGHVDRRLVYDYMGSRCRWWWAALAQNTRRARREAEDPTVGEHFEWLAGVMAELDRKAGVGVPYDDAHLWSTLDRRIQNAQDRMDAAVELRGAVVSRPMSLGAPPSASPVSRRRQTSTAH